MNRFSFPSAVCRLGALMTFVASAAAAGAMPAPFVELQFERDGVNTGQHGGSTQTVDYVAGEGPRRTAGPWGKGISKGARGPAKGSEVVSNDKTTVLGMLLVCHGEFRDRSVRRLRLFRKAADRRSQSLRGLRRGSVCVAVYLGLGSGTHGSFGVGMCCKPIVIYPALLLRYAANHHGSLRGEKRIAVDFN